MIKWETTLQSAQVLDAQLKTNDLSAPTSRGTLAGIYKPDPRNYSHHIGVVIVGIKNSLTFWVRGMIGCRGRI